MHALARAGVQPLRTAYQALIERYGPDVVVLVDGGTHILMRGDESGPGTPEEDLASVAALAGIQGPERLVVAIGFGVDAHHGVSHGAVLENIAALERAGAYLGAFSVPRTAAAAPDPPLTPVNTPDAEGAWPESAVRQRGSWRRGPFRT